MGLTRQNKIIDYFKIQSQNQPCGNNFIRSILPFYKFTEILNCLTCDIRWIFIKIEERMKNIWDPDQNIGWDKSTSKSKVDIIHIICLFLENQIIEKTV